MRETWEMKKLGDVCDISAGGDVPKNDFSEIKTEKYNIPIYANGEKNDGLYGFTNTAKVLKPSITVSARGTIGFSVTRIEPFFPIVRLIVITPKNEELDLSYLKYGISTMDFKHSGTSIPQLTVPMIKNYEFPVPPLAEQQRIVAYLDATFASLHQAKANLKINLQNAKELFETELRNVFENKDEAWEEKSLGEVLIKTETIDPTKKPNEEFIYLDVSSVNKETKEIENAVSLLGKDAPSRARKLIKENDIIFATVRPTHNRVAIITEEYNEQVCSTGYYVLRPKNILNYKFLYYYLRTNEFNNQMEILQKGASYPAVNDNDVKIQIINFPKSLQTQQEIVAKLDALKTQTQQLETLYQTKLSNLEELKSGILKRAFEGQMSEPMIITD